jgi:propionate CoA-transferase
MRKVRFVSAEEAVARIPDGATLSISGAWMLVPDRTLAALEARFLATGHPRNLTATFLLCPGGTPDQPGIDRLAHEGLLARTIGGSYPNLPASPLRKLIEENRVAAYNPPAGLIAAWHREVGAGRPGPLTRTGLGTFADPRLEGARMNAAAVEDLLQIVTVGGAEYLHWPSAPVDVALIRATSADESGNLTMEDESAALLACAQAAAARASGGRVIAQVKRTVPRGSLKPHEVKIPGALVDWVVVEPHGLQAGGIAYDPALCGAARREFDGQVPGSESERWIARRAARELADGDVVVLGYGISAVVPYLLLAGGEFDRATFTIEHGSWGGLPLTDFRFGSSANPAVILDAATQFDLFQGGCFDIALLSFLQVDERGRVNVHKLDARPALSAGIGGFLDIAANAPRLLLMGYFTAGGLKTRIAGQRIAIESEGRMKKFVRRLDHVSYDPAFARNREVLYITERGVFRLEEGQLVLTEVAPGVDLERDILAQMEFMPRIALVKSAHDRSPAWNQGNSIRTSSSTMYPSGRRDRHTG